MDYRSNEDHLYRNQKVGANYNHIFTVDNISEESEPVTEPVTLQEVKDYIRLEGFTPDDDSPSSGFDFDNGLIEELITEARLWVEKYTGVNLIRRQLQVQALNQAGYLELPGPVLDVTTVVITKENSDLIPTTDYTFIGKDFPKLVTKFEPRLSIIYEAGYTAANIPKGLKTAIKAYVAYAYEHRGEELDDKALTESAARKARPYRRLALFG